MTEARYEERIVPFTAGDGFECNLIHVWGDTPATKGPVLLVHGAGVRANIFRAPIRCGFVEYLIQHGYDVWLENWRASIDFAPNIWSLDQAALYDHPAAVRAVVKETGSDQIKAVIHCQGSTSFAMSAVAGLIPEVSVIVANAVTLHPVVPTWSKFKLAVATPLMALVTRYLNPQWGLQAPTLVAKAIRLMVNLSHRECDNPVCKQVSFTYGAGFPALWRHENLNAETHEWLKHEFAAVPLRFFKQMARCVKNGSLVSVEGFQELPQDFAGQEPRTSARFALFAGAKNLCFLKESQERTKTFLDSHRRDYHSLHVFETYGHLDVFMGKNAVEDTYPQMLAELDRS